MVTRDRPQCWRRDRKTTDTTDTRRKDCDFGAAQTSDIVLFCFLNEDKLRNKYY